MKSTINLIIFSFSIIIFFQANAQELENNSTSFSDKDYEIFGTDEKIPFALVGYIYQIPEGSQMLPAKFNTENSIGKIHTQELNIPPRDFDQGFPGFPDLMEWFALDYHGFFYIDENKEYEFAITSDDGSKLYIDEKLVINNDGQHGPNTMYKKVHLKKGLHRMNVQYFQGPRFLIALKLMYRTDDGSFDIFRYSDFMPLTIYKELFESNKTSNTINIDIKEFLLFEFNSYVLKDNARLVLDEIYYSFIDNNDSVGIIIKGHTDDIGTDEYNQKLSEQRAQSVYGHFASNFEISNRMWSIGYGESDPKVPNNNDDNRAQNRRVEIMIMPKSDAKKFHESSQEN